MKPRIPGAVARILAALAIGGAAQAGEARAGPGDVPAVRISPEDGKAVAGKVPVTFGQIFRPGDIPGGRTIVARAGDRDVPIQIDVKRRHPDGSVRFAVISAVLAGLEAGGIRLELAAGPDDAKPPRPTDPSKAAAELLAAGFDAAVVLAFPEGKAVRAGARKMLEAAPRAWLRGPLATELLLEGPPVDAQGDADPDLNVQFQVRIYEGLNAARVSVVVENCWDTWAGHIGYDVEVKLGAGGETAWGQKDVDHRPLSRWRKVFWWGPAPPRIHIAHDPDYLFATRALPRYDTTLEVPETILARLDASWARAKTGILENGLLCAYMPTTGLRDEIGPYPAWAVLCLLSGDARATKAVLGSGDLAGSWPIHVRSARTRRPLTLDDRPLLWMRGYRDGDRYERPRWKPDRKAPAADALKLSPDCAHQGSYAYIPYLLTGDFYYLEEAYFWAHYCLLSQWTTPRQDGKGLVVGDQVRGQAWALRNIADAAFIGPDGDPQVEGLDGKIRNTLAWYARTFYGPPESNAMGFCFPRDVRDARIQNPANPDWMVTAPWEHDFLIWSLHHLAELGYEEAARPRDFELRWRVGTLTRADYDPALATPYRMVVGEKGSDKKVRFYEDWKKLSEENARLSKPGFPYAYSAWIALVAGVDAGFPGAGKALDVLESKASPRPWNIHNWFAMRPRTREGKR